LLRQNGLKVLRPHKYHLDKIAEEAPMSWQVNEIRPPEPESRRELKPSFALVRLVGAVSFSTAGILTSKLVPSLFGMNQALWDRPEWTLGTVALLIVCIVAALVGGVVGVGIAAGIRVTSDRVDYGINAVWQYLANGSIVAFLLWSLILVKLFGKDGSKHFVQDQGQLRAFLATIGISAVACVIVGTILAIAGRIAPNRRTNFVPNMLLAAPLRTAR
jgi:hypothetical protein